MSAGQNKPQSFEELARQRRTTETISALLREQLTGYLETLRPILAPERVFGKYAGARSEVPGADRALAEVQQNLRQYTRQPFDLPAELDQHWLTLVGNRLELYPWEYDHEARNERESKAITMTSPIKWIVNYASNYNGQQFKQVLAGREPRRPEHVRQFVVNALVLQVALARHTGLVSLLHGLRFELKTEQAADFRHLPLATISACLPAFRPADDLILSATAFSGIPAFIEFLDTEAVRNLKDPLREQIERALA